MFPLAPITTIPKQPLMTITHGVSFELTLKRSKFIAFLEPASTVDQAQAILDGYREKYWDAVHHCYAWRIGITGLQYRMGDDGEPAGSAGKPMLFVLQRAHISNTVAVVVRYFGGVKLGVGPLARSYTEAVSSALQLADIQPLVITEHLLVHCVYEDVSRLKALFTEVEATFDSNFSDAVSFDVYVPVHKIEYFIQEVSSRTNGRAGFSKVTAD